MRSVVAVMGFAMGDATPRERRNHLKEDTMLRRLSFLLAALALIGFAMAQSFVISPVDGTDYEDVVSEIGENSADVSQTVILDLPKATALHLAASTLEFDLTAENWADKLVCAYTTGPDHTFTNHGQLNTVPGGIYYSAPSWDEIELANWYANNAQVGYAPGLVRVTTYPPVLLDDANQLVPYSKDYFVCYQTFVLQLFANYDGWELTVERFDALDDGIEHLYIQANTCADFGVDTGLYELEVGKPINLIPDTYTGGTTGALAKKSGSDCRTNTSWLDLLVPIAVKINADEFGPNTTTLTYTLMDPNP